MTDILYIVGSGSEWNNNELRYSLRSIAKNGRNIGRVFLVGYKPDWVSDEVIHIPCGDPYDRKHKNILNKVVYAMEHSDIGSHFLISSDDHYYMMPTDFDKLPIYYKAREIPAKVVGRKRWEEYSLSVHDTRGILEERGLPIYQTNPHCNTHWDAEVYRANKALFDLCMWLPLGGEMNCVMGNLLISSGATPIEFNDAKLSRDLTEAEIARRAKKSGCISSVPEIEGSTLAHYLEKVFNDKCKYEI